MPLLVGAAAGLWLARMEALACDSAECRIPQSMQGTSVAHDRRSDPSLCSTCRKAHSKLHSKPTPCIWGLSFYMTQLPTSQQAAAELMQLVVAEHMIAIGVSSSRCLPCTLQSSTEILDLVPRSDHNPDD